jgi:hypothetical protein
VLAELRRHAGCWAACLRSARAGAQTDAAMSATIIHRPLCLHNSKGWGDVHVQRFKAAQTQREGMRMMNLLNAAGQNAHERRRQSAQVGESPQAPLQKLGPPACCCCGTSVEAHAGATERAGGGRGRAQGVLARCSWVSTKIPTDHHPYPHTTAMSAGANPMEPWPQLVIDMNGCQLDRGSNAM